MKAVSTTSSVRGSMQLLKVALVYFAIVFGTGFVLGLFRVLWLIPRFGERNAELIEQPLMLIAVILAARWSIRRTRPALTPIESLAVGLIALTFLVVVELLVVLELRGVSISEYVRSRDPVSGIVYLLMLAVFALMPLLLSRRRSLRTGKINLLRV
jgi:hypothetical protein